MEPPSRSADALRSGQVRAVSSLPPLMVAQCCWRSEAWPRRCSITQQGGLQLSEGLGACVVALRLPSPQGDCRGQLLRRDAQLPKGAGAPMRAC